MSHAAGFGFLAMHIACSFNKCRWFDPLSNVINVGMKSVTLALSKLLSGGYRMFPASLPRVLESRSVRRCLIVTIGTHTPPPYRPAYECHI